MSQTYDHMSGMNDNEIYVEMKHCADTAETIKKHCADTAETIKKHCADTEQSPETVKNEDESRAPTCTPTWWWIATSVVSLAVFGTIVTIVAKYKSHTCPACPVHWVGYNRTCYYFSKAKKNWAASRDACSAERAQLLVMSDFWELDFLQTHTKELHWIGLRRKNATSDWFWEGGLGIVPKVFSNSVVQECGVLLDSGIGASSCSVLLSWICKKCLN